MINWEQLIASFFGSLGFALVFHLRGMKLFWSSLGGAIAWFVYLALGLFVQSFMVKMAIAGFVLGIYCEIMSIQTHLPRTVYIAVGIIPLIPGAGLYYTMLYFYKHDMKLSLHYAKASLGTSAAIIIGLLFAMEIWGIYRRRRDAKLVQGHM